MLTASTPTGLAMQAPHWIFYVYVLGAILTATVGYFVLRWLRQRVYGGGLDEPAMTVERAEQMLEAGMISQEEFATMRRVILGLPEKTAGTSRRACGSDDFKVDG